MILFSAVRRVAFSRLARSARVSLQSGATQRVTVAVSRAQLSFQDDSSAAGAWRVVPGTYTIRVGPSSVDDTLVADVVV